MLIGLGSEAQQQLHGLRMEKTAKDMLGKTSHLSKRGLEGFFKFSSFENNILWFIRNCFEFQLIICHEKAKKKISELKC